MFEGGGYGVGVTVDVLAVAPWPDALPDGVTARPTRLGEMMPVAARTDAEIAGELQRIQQVEARLAAYTAELVAELASRRPGTLDREEGEPGAASPDWLPGPGNEPVPQVSEFFADELALVLNCSRTAATTLAQVAGLLVGRLPATWAALADGTLDWPRARAIAAELGPVAHDVEPHVLCAVEAAVLPTAHELSVTRIRAAVRRELLQHDADAAERRRKQAERCADVTVRPARDGMAELGAFAPQPLAAAIRDTVDAYARMAKADGDPRPIGQLRVAALADLVLRPWDTSRPPVTAHLDVVATLGALVSASAGHDACAVGHHVHRPSDHGACGVGCRNVVPAEVNGHPITAGQLRELLEQLDALCPGGLQAPSGGTLGLSLLDPATGALRAAARRSELERLARRGCPDHPGGECACPVLDRPAVTDRYRPSAAQRRFTTTRDRACRHPGCRVRAGWADLDHVVPHAHGGATACENLCCLCRRHHRLKTWAPGWRFEMTADGVLTVTTPSGVTRVTRPPGHLPGVAGPARSVEPARSGELAGCDPAPF